MRWQNIWLLKKNFSCLNGFKNSKTSWGINTLRMWHTAVVLIDIEYSIITQKIIVTDACEFGNSNLPLKTEF